MLHVLALCYSITKILGILRWHTNQLFYILVCGANDVLLIAVHFNLGYDRMQVPRRKSPTDVQVGFYFHGIYSVSEHDMEFSAKCYFRTAWQDPRLKV